MIIPSFRVEEGWCRSFQPQQTADMTGLPLEEVIAKYAILEEEFQSWCFKNSDKENVE